MIKKMFLLALVLSLSGFGASAATIVDVEYVGPRSYSVSNSTYDDLYMVRINGGPLMLVACDSRSWTITKGQEYQAYLVWLSIPSDLSYLRFQGSSLLERYGESSLLYERQLTASQSEFSGLHRAIQESVDTSLTPTVLTQPYLDWADNSYNALSESGKASLWARTFAIKPTPQYSHLQEFVGQGEQVPEPSSGWLAGIALLSVPTSQLRRWRRRKK